MKTPFVLSIVLLAGAAFAQPPAIDHSLESGTLHNLREQPRLFHPDEPYQIHGRHFTFSGLAVQIDKSPAPLGMFNLFDADNFDPSMNNTVWDEKTGRAVGWSLFTIKF